MAALAPATDCSTYVLFAESPPTTWSVGLSSTAYPWVSRNRWDAPLGSTNRLGLPTTWLAASAEANSRGYTQKMTGTFRPSVESGGQYRATESFTPSAR